MLETPWVEEAKTIGWDADPSSIGTSCDDDDDDVGRDDEVPGSEPTAHRDERPVWGRYPFDGAFQVRFGYV